MLLVVPLGCPRRQIFRRSTFARLRKEERLDKKCHCVAHKECNRDHHSNNNRNPRSKKSAADAICVQFGRTTHASKSECAHTRTFNVGERGSKRWSNLKFFFLNVSTVYRPGQDRMEKPHRATWFMKHNWARYKRRYRRCRRSVRYPHAAASSQVCFESLPSTSFGVKTSDIVWVVGTLFFTKELSIRSFLTRTSFIGCRCRGTDPILGSDVASVTKN